MVRRKCLKCGLVIWNRSKQAKYCLDCLNGVDRSYFKTNIALQNDYNVK